MPTVKEQRQFFLPESGLVYFSYRLLNRMQCRIDKIVVCLKVAESMGEGKERDA